MSALARGVGLYALSDFELAGAIAYVGWLLFLLTFALAFLWWRDRP